MRVLEHRPDKDLGGQFHCLTQLPQVPPLPFQEVSAIPESRRHVVLQCRLEGADQVVMGGQKHYIIGPISAEHHLEDSADDCPGLPGACSPGKEHRPYIRFHETVLKGIEIAKFSEHIGLWETKFLIQK